MLLEADIQGDFEIEGEEIPGAVLNICIYPGANGANSMHMKKTMDEWGKDPSVQSVRRLFGLFEREYDRLLKELNLSSLDARLRPAREGALRLYGRACSLAAAKRLGWDEKTHAAVYMECLVLVLSRQGIPIPEGVRQAHQAHGDLLREVTA